MFEAYSVEQVIITERGSGTQTRNAIIGGALGGGIGLGSALLIGGGIGLALGGGAIGIPFIAVLGGLTLGGAGTGSLAGFASGKSHVTIVSGETLIFPSYGPAEWGSMLLASIVLLMISVSYIRFLRTNSDKQAN